MKKAEMDPIRVVSENRTSIEVAAAGQNRRKKPPLSSTLPRGKGCEIGVKKIGKYYTRNPVGGKGSSLTARNRSDISSPKGMLRGSLCIVSLNF